MYEQGIVKKIKNCLAYVEIQKKPQCNGCRICMFGDETSIVLPSFMETECKIGDTVVLKMPEHPITGASLLLFLLPLALFFAGLLTGFPLGEWFMLFFGLVFAAAGVCISFVVDWLLRFNPKYIPVVTDKILIEKPKEKEVDND